MQLDGKRIIVTGAASGIAAATVLACARAGAAVVSLDINDQAGAAVAGEAAKLGTRPSTYMHCNVRRQDEVNAVFEKAVAQLGGLDVLVNMAGVALPKPAESLTEADLDFVHSIHVKGTVFTNQAAFRSMRNSGGSIINAGSMAGVRGFAGNAAYCEVKGAVLAWTRSVAQEWAAHRVRVNAICPMVMTPMAQSWIDEMSEENRAAMRVYLIKQAIPLGGWYGEPEDAANLNVFLASDASRFITGQSLAVDGGMMMVS